jgi:hypothetical protein
MYAGPPRLMAPGAFKPFPVMANISPEAANSPKAMRESILDQLTGAASTGPAPQQTQDFMQLNNPPAAMFAHKMGCLAAKLAQENGKEGVNFMDETNATSTA